MHPTRRSHRDGAGGTTAPAARDQDEQVASRRYYRQHDRTGSRPREARVGPDARRSDAVAPGLPDQGVAGIIAGQDPRLRVGAGGPRNTRWRPRGPARRPSSYGRYSMTVGDDQVRAGSRGEASGLARGIHGAFRPVSAREDERERPVGGHLVAATTALSPRAGPPGQPCRDGHGRARADTVRSRRAACSVETTPPRSRWRSGHPDRGHRRGCRLLRVEGEVKGTMHRRTGGDALPQGRVEANIRRGASSWRQVKGNVAAKGDVSSRRQPARREHPRPNVERGRGGHGRHRRQGQGGARPRAARGSQITSMTLAIAEGAVFIGSSTWARVSRAPSGAGPVSERARESRSLSPRGSAPRSASRSADRLPHCSR